MTEPEPKLVLHVGETFGIANIHVVCDADGSTEPLGRTARFLGKGGAGTVYRCIYGGQQHRAVKFLTLGELDENRTGRRREDFERTFSNETKILYQLSHSNISVLHEHGIHKDSTGQEWRYLVTDYVAGPMLKDAISQPEVTGEEIYAILGDVFKAVAYLHTHDVYHCDIKKENIKLRQIGGKSGDVVLLDWGAAQVVPRTPMASWTELIRVEEGDTATRRFVSTKRITHQDHLSHLRGARLTVYELAEFVHLHELHTIGVLLRELTESEPTLEEPNPWQTSVKRRLWKVFGKSGGVAFAGMITDLLSAPRLRDKSPYQSVSAFVDDWAKLHSNYLAPAGVPELGLASEFKYSTPTAVGRTVISPRFGEVISHRLVNRLHDVPQLESTYLKFAGATHTRLSHSLAVLRNAKYYISHLLNDSRFRRAAEVEDIEATLLLALLHDSGHYQLSHMFEDLATDQAGRRNASPWDKVDFDIPTDDTLFRYLILERGAGTGPLRGDYGPLVADRVREVHLESGANLIAGPYESLGQVISSGFGEPTLGILLQMHDAIYGKGPSQLTSAQQVLAAVISSDIDADKTAYLVEDALRTGVPYGLAVDLDGILGSLCMPSDEDLSASNRPAIGLLRRGVPAAQGIAVARNQMLSQVYWNHTNRAVTAMVKHVIMRLLQANAFDVQQYLGLALFAGRSECLSWLRSTYTATFGRESVNPVAGLVAGGRHLYRRVAVVRPGLVDEPSGLNDGLLKYTFKEILELQDVLANALGELPFMAGLRSGEVLVDIPTKEREKPSGERGGRVCVYDPPHTVTSQPLARVAPLYDHLKRQHRDLNRVCRVYVAPARYTSLGESQLQTIMTRALSVLQEEVGL